MAHAAKSFLAILLLAVSLAGAQEVDEPGELPTKLRAEVHYSVVRPDSYGEVWNIRLQITPVIPSPFIK